jgi:hypothetical protein
MNGLKSAGWVAPPGRRRHAPHAQLTVRTFDETDDSRLKPV